MTSSQGSSPTRRRSLTIAHLGPALAVLIATLGGFWSFASHARAEGEPKELSSWAVREGSKATVAARELALPTAIAFIPNPGTEPSDPRYFVAELRGKVRVVTNDGSVHDFADVATVSPPGEFPASEGENGLGGLCLAPEQGYVFATYVYEDKNGVLRNDITRFAGEPNTFGLEATSHTSFSKLLAPYPSSVSHQIGGCRVDAGHLYVGVGDGGSPGASRDTSQLLGKVLSLTLDGAAHPDNPLYNAQQPDDPKGFVYAWGLRNPFGITVVKGRVFVSENGPSIDAFLEVERGVDYLWDGSDESVASNALFVIAPGSSPVHLDSGPSPTGADVERFFIAIAGTRRGLPGGVVTLDVDLRSGRVSTRPKTLVEYVGPESLGAGTVAAVAVGPDGVYFAPLLSETGPVNPVIKVTDDPSGSYPTIIGRTGGPAGLIQSYGCSSCHQIDGEGGTAGPALDLQSLRLRNLARLNTPAYEQKLDDLDKLTEEPFASTRDARAAVRDATGEARVAAYVEQHILEPKFDDPTAQMPQLNVSPTDAEAITGFLLSKPPRESLLERITTRERAQGLAAGALLGFLAALVAVWIVRRIRRRVARQGPELP